MIERLCACVLGSTLALLAGCAMASWAGDGSLVSRYVAGDNYRVISQPIAHPTGTIPVLEFFSYGCRHCYTLDAAVSRWQKTLPDDVTFRRVPVISGNDGRFYARLFYTEQALGVLQRLHAKLFAAIHDGHHDLANFAAARAFFVAHGVDGKHFAEVFNSPAIDERIVRALRLMRAFQVRAVPSLGVAGRYWLDGAMAGGNKAMFGVAEYLIERSRASAAADAP